MCLDLQSLLPVDCRKRLNQQKNRMKLAGEVNSDGKIISPYRFVIGPGEKHMADFSKNLSEICDKFSWVRSKSLEPMMETLLRKVQYSMLINIIDKVQNNKKTPAYFFITIFINDIYFSASIEEIRDYFDFYSNIESFTDPEKSSSCYNHIEKSHVTSINDLPGGDPEFILSGDDRISEVDNNSYSMEFNNDYYITTFHRDDSCLWKRIYFRIDNDLSP